MMNVQYSKIWTDLLLKKQKIYSEGVNQLIFLRIVYVLYRFYNNYFVIIDDRLIEDLNKLDASHTIFHWK